MFKELLGAAFLAWPLVLIVLIVLAFVLAIGVSVFFASRTGRGKWRWALVGFLVVYVPIFWDWIPTVAMHRYYCEKEAGFWVYKTLEEWKAENPGAIEGLVANKGEPHNSTGDELQYTNVYFLNSRFNMIVKRSGQLPLKRWRYERVLIDTIKDEALARYVDFSTSQERRQAGWSGWKFWLDSRHCSGGRDNAIKSGNWINQFKGIEK